MISHWPLGAGHRPLSCHGIGLAGGWVGVTWRPVALGGDAFSPLTGRRGRPCQALIGRDARARRELHAAEAGAAPPEPGGTRRDR